MVQTTIDATATAAATPAHGDKPTFQRAPSKLARQMTSAISLGALSRQMGKVSQGPARRMQMHSQAERCRSRRHNGRDADLDASHVGNTSPSEHSGSDSFARSDAGFDSFTRRSRRSVSRRRSIVRTRRAIFSVLRTPTSIWESANLTYSHAAAASLIGRRVQGERLTWRQHAFLILEEPASGPAAYVLSLVLRATIALNVVASTLESLSRVTEVTGVLVWSYIAMACNGVLTLEACARILCYLPRRAAALRDPFVWLDALSVLPFWLFLMLNLGLRANRPTATESTSWYLRLLVSLGSVRLLKLCRYYDGAGLLVRALSRSAKQLYVPLFMLLLMVVSFSTLLYALEFSSEVHACATYWEEANVTPAFLLAHPDGVTWTCDVCEAAVAGRDRAGASRVGDMCTTCNGWPDGHPECVGSVLACASRSSSVRSRRRCGSYL